MPPTAAIGLAVTPDEPVATAAVKDVELVIIPQPRFRAVLPVAVMPVTAFSSRLITQYLPLGTIVAVEVAVIVGTLGRNRPEKANRFWIERLTRTARGSAVNPPTEGGFVTSQVGVTPTT